MTKTLGSAALQLYAGVAAMFLPIENQPGLIADLESDLFVRHALSSDTCQLYHCYGMYLAPLTAALTTLKHCQFGHCCPVGVYDGGDQAGESRDGWVARLPSVVAARNCEVTRLTGKKPSDTIKVKTVAQKPSSVVPDCPVGLKEQRLPSGVGVSLSVPAGRAEGSGWCSATDPV